MTVARFMGSTEPGARIENVYSGTRHSQFPYKPQGHLSRIGFRNFIARNLSRQLFRPRWGESRIRALRTLAEGSLF